MFTMLQGVIKLESLSNQKDSGTVLSKHSVGEAWSWQIVLCKFKSRLGETGIR